MPQSEALECRFQKGNGCCDGFRIRSLHAHGALQGTPPLLRFFRPLVLSSFLVVDGILAARPTQLTLWQQWIDANGGALDLHRASHQQRRMLSRGLRGFGLSRCDRAQDEKDKDKGEATPGFAPR